MRRGDRWLLLLIVLLRLFLLPLRLAKSLQLAQCWSLPVGRLGAGVLLGKLRVVSCGTLSAGGSAESIGATS